MNVDGPDFDCRSFSTNYKLFVDCPLVSTLPITSNKLGEPIILISIVFHAPVILSPILFLFRLSGSMLCLVYVCIFIISIILFTELQTVEILLDISTSEWKMFCAASPKVPVIRDLSLVIMILLYHAETLFSEMRFM